jgi:hypothetical protein
VTGQFQQLQEQLFAAETRSTALFVELEELKKSSSLREEALSAQLAQAVAEVEGREAAAAKAAANAVADAETRHGAALAEAQTTMAHRIALGNGHIRARLADSMLQLTMLTGWRTVVARVWLESELQQRFKEHSQRSAADSAASVIEEGGARIGALLWSPDKGHITDQHTGMVRTSETAAAAASSARLGGAAWAAAMDSCLQRSVLKLWRTAALQKRAVGAIQAQLFAEQSQRTALVEAQRLKGESRLMQVEAAHRDTVQRIKSEALTAQAKHDEALAAYETQLSARLAASEAEAQDASAQRETETRQRIDAALEVQRAQSDLLFVQAQTQYQEAIRTQQQNHNSRYAELLQVLKQMAPPDLAEILDMDTGDTGESSVSSDEGPAIN